MFCYLLVLNADILSRQCCEIVTANSDKLRNFVLCRVNRSMNEKEVLLHQPLCSNLRSSGSKCTVLKKWFVTLLALYGALIVIQRPGNFAPLIPLRSRRHFCYGVERAKHFVNVHWPCIVSNKERISKISSLPTWKSFCGRMCFCLEIFQVCGIFPWCFSCFLPANTTKNLNSRNFDQPFLCNIQSLETWNLRDKTWKLWDQDS